MVRFLLRMIGFVLAAAAFSALIVDGTRSVAAKHVMMFSLDETFGWFSPAALASIKAVIDHAPQAARPMLSYALTLPTGLAALAIALVFLVTGRRPPKKIGFAGGE